MKSYARLAPPRSSLVLWEASCGTERDRSRDRRGYLSGSRGGPASKGSSVVRGAREGQPGRGPLALKKTRDRGTGTTHAESLTSRADTRRMDGSVHGSNASDLDASSEKFPFLTHPLGYLRATSLLRFGFEPRPLAASLRGE
ncbi:hypothetical protein KM043_007204 [Ampulex compressa]|nr:hypothetical protein KM043_007204 [Ampulex compressa]